MALNPNIPLQVKVPSVAEAINIYDQERAFQNQQDLQQQQLSQNQQRLDMLGQNQESQQDIRGAQLEGLKIKNQQAEQDMQQKSMAVTALQLSRLKNDPKAQEQLLLDRSERLKAEGKNNRETDEELELLMSDRKKFNQDIDKAVQLSYDSGILKRQQTPSSVQEYEYVKKLLPVEQERYFKVKRTQGDFRYDPVTGRKELYPGVAEGKQQLKSAEETGKLLAKQKIERTPAEVATDKAFAPDYVKFVTGESSDMQKQIKQLDNVVSTLDKVIKDSKDIEAGTKFRIKDGKKEKLIEKDLSSPRIGITPDFIQAVSDPEALAIRERVEEVAQRNLRIILGAQFTEKEGEKLIARVYNQKLDEKENLKRVKALSKQMTKAFKAKDSAADYYAENGTLKGWNGKIMTLSDIEEGFNEETSKKSKTEQIIDFNDL